MPPHPRARRPHAPPEVVPASAFFPIFGPERQRRQLFPKRDFPSPSPTNARARAITARASVDSVGMFAALFPPPPPPIAVGVAVAAGVGVRVRLGAAVAVGIGVAAVPVAVTVGVGVGMTAVPVVATVGVGVGRTAVGVAIAVGVGVDWASASCPMPTKRIAIERCHKRVFKVFSFSTDYLSYDFSRPSIRLSDYQSRVNHRRGPLTPVLPSSISTGPLRHKGVRKPGGRSWLDPPGGVQVTSRYGRSVVQA